MKENFEPLLRKLKIEPGSECDLGEKIKNVLRKLKAEMEKRVIPGIETYDEISKFMKEEGIYYGKDITVTLPIHSFFSREFKPIQKHGLREGLYYFFENTPVPDGIRSDIRLYEEMEANVDEYVKEHNGKPDPKEFTDFVYSCHPKNIDEPRVNQNYNELRSKYYIPFHETKDENHLDKDIRSALKDIDLSDIK